MPFDEQNPRKLLTIVTESAIESYLVRDLDKLGAPGFTITNARGKGERGVRKAAWDADSNIRVEIICDLSIAQRIARHLRETYYDNYAMVMTLSDVQVLRPEKFQS